MPASSSLNFPSLVATVLPACHANGSSSAQLFVFFFNDTATTEIYTLSLHDALSIWRDIGHAEAVAIALSNLGIAAIERNAFAEAVPYVEEGFKLARGLGFRSQLAHAVGVCATVAARTSAPQRAARLVAAA